MNIEQVDRILFDILTNPYFLAFYLVVLVVSAWLIATAIIALQDRALKKRLDSISQASFNRQKAEMIAHWEFCKRYNVPTKITDKYRTIYND